MSVSTCTWSGRVFEVHPPSVTWNPIPGVYIFAGTNPSNQWYPLYIGQADSLAARLSTHERWWEARLHGATHVHVMHVPTKNDRDAIEQALIAAYQPRLNVHHR